MSASSVFFAASERLAVGLRCVELQRRNPDALPLLQPVLAVGALAVDAQLAFADDALDMGKRQAGKPRFQKAVDPHVGFICRNDDGLHFCGQRRRLGDISLALQQMVRAWPRAARDAKRAAACRQADAPRGRSACEPRYGRAPFGRSPDTRFARGLLTRRLMMKLRMHVGYRKVTHRHGKSLQILPAQNHWKHVLGDDNDEREHSRWHWRNRLLARFRGAAAAQKARCLLKSREIARNRPRRRNPPQTAPLYAPLHQKSLCAASRSIANQIGARPQSALKPSAGSGSRPPNLNLVHGGAIHCRKQTRLQPDTAKP